MQAKRCTKMEFGKIAVILLLIPVVFALHTYESYEASIFVLSAVALIFGFISFASPCSLPILPAYIAYSMKSSHKTIKWMSVAFFLGLAVVFTLLGAGATMIGELISSNLEIFSQVTGIMIMVFGAYIILGKGLPGVNVKQETPTSYLGAGIFGALVGISWTPCVGPILIAILLLATTTDSAIAGGILLFSYAVGLSLPLILVSMYLEKIDKKGLFWRFIKGKMLHFELSGNKFSVHSSALISGVLFIIIGHLVFIGSMAAINSYFVDTHLQAWINMIEEFIFNSFLG